MSISYEVYRHWSPAGEPKRYCNTKSDDSGFGSWLFCDHKHPTHEEAEDCREFISDRQERPSRV
jgi:hypothetical protein